MSRDLTKKLRGSYRYSLQYIDGFCYNEKLEKW